MRNPSAQLMLSCKLSAGGCSLQLPKPGSTTLESLSPTERAELKPFTAHLFPVVLQVQLLTVGSRKAMSKIPVNHSGLARPFGYLLPK